MSIATRVWFRLVSGAGAGILALMCDMCGPVERRPSILLVVIDSLRADRLHHAGDPRPLSPRLDGLAEQSTRFTQARSAAPWTTPSVMTLFTGLTPLSHHVDKNDRVLADSVQTLAERLKEAGYATGAVMPALTLADYFGFDRGFDLFVFEAQGHGRVSGPWSVEHAMTFLRAQKGVPFFIYVHLWDVHYNYNPPVPDSLRFQAGRPPGPGETDDVTALIDFSSHADEVEPLPADRVAWLEGQYAGEVLFTDGQVGRLLDELERLDLAQDTIVVVTSDHGEAFQEHKILGHTVHLYDELQHVPLILRWTGRIPAGRAVDHPVGLVDVTPTLLDLAGIPYEESEFEGHSRAATVLRLPGSSPDAEEEAEPILLTTSRRANLRGIWSPETTYIYDFLKQREELYDLRSDTGQLENLAAARPQEAVAWRRLLCNRLAATPARGEVPIELLSSDIKEVLDAGLRTLGYVGSPSKESPLQRLQDASKERRHFLQALGCDDLF